MRFLPSGIELPSRFGDNVLRWRFGIVAVVVSVSILSALQVARMPMQTSLLESFLQDPQEYQLYRSRVKAFGADSYGLVFVATDEGPSLFTPYKLNAVRTAARELEKLPEVQRVTCFVDALSVQHRQQLSAREVMRRTVARRKLEAGELDIKGNGFLVSRYWPDSPTAQSKVDLGQMREAMLRDERVSGLLLAKDGSAQVMAVQITAADDLPPADQQLLAGKISNTIRKQGLGSRGVYSAGMILSQGYMFEEVGKALRILFPAGLIIICLVVFALFRRVSVVVITAAIGLISILWALAATSLIFGKLSILVAAAPLLILVISTSDVIHLVTAYRNELSAGLDQPQALRKAMAEVGGACLLTSVTTFIGFMSLLAIPAPSTRHLALASSIGVGVALILALTLVPITLSFLRPMPAPHTSPILRASNGLLGRLVSCCQYVSTVHSWPTVLACAALLLVGLGSVKFMHVDIDYAKRFKAHHPLRESMTFFREKLAGSATVDVFLRSEESSILTPDNLTAIAHFDEQVKQIPEVTAVRSIASFYRLTSQLLYLDSHDGIPDSPKTVKACARVFEQADNGNLRAMLTKDTHDARISVQLSTSGFLEITDIARRIDSIGKSTFPQSVVVNTSGSYPIIGEVAAKMIRSQLFGLATCFVSICIVMAIGIGSFRNALWAQLPNMLPVALILGFLAVTLDTVDIDMLGLPTVALGLAVDDTIHFLHRFKIELHKSNDRVAALSKTFEFSGQAILQTTVILCIGLLPFALGGFVTVWILGTYLVVTLVLAVLADLLLLPALIRIGFIT